MATTAEPEFVAETLAWCNSIRAEKGMEPLDCLPKGLPGDPASCPCGAATGLRVRVYTYDDGVDGDPMMRGAVPDAVNEFVISFDDGQLPQYDARLDASR